jgi:hypothetical protein
MKTKMKIKGRVKSLVLAGGKSMINLFYWSKNSKGEIISCQNFSFASFNPII